MKINKLSPAFTTDRVEETRDFYVKHLGARVNFDCGWYVDLEFGDGQNTLQFMSPKHESHELSSGAGLIYNFCVEDVDSVYKELTTAGLEVVVPLEDHPWGDRGFAVKDPNGISIYIYTETEPDDEFKQYFK